MCYKLLNEVYQNQDVQPLYSSVLDLKALARTSYVDREKIYRTVARYCYDLENPIRGALLIPLIHLTDGADKYDLYRIYENTIPANFPWIINNRDRLFSDEVKALVLRYDKDSGEAVIVEETMGNRDELKNKICRYISRPKNELLLGLIVRTEAYVEKKGLLT